MCTLQYVGCHNSISSKEIEHCREFIATPLQFYKSKIDGGIVVGFAGTNYFKDAGTIVCCQLNGRDNDIVEKISVEVTSVARDWNTGKILYVSADEGDPLINVLTNNGWEKRSQTLYKEKTNLERILKPKIKADINKSKYRAEGLTSENKGQTDKFFFNNLGGMVVEHKITDGCCSRLIFDNDSNAIVAAVLMVHHNKKLYVKYFAVEDALRRSLVFLYLLNEIGQSIINYSISEVYYSIYDDNIAMNSLKKKTDLQVLTKKIFMTKNTKTHG